MPGRSCRRGMHTPGPFVTVAGTNTKCDLASTAQLREREDSESSSSRGAVVIVPCKQSLSAKQRQESAKDELEALFSPSRCGCSTLWYISWPCRESLLCHSSFLASSLPFLLAYALDHPQQTIAIASRWHQKKPEHPLGLHSGSQKPGTDNFHNWFQPSFFVCGWLLAPILAATSL